MEKRVPLWQIFAVFAKIGAFTIGGGYAMIPLIQAELSRRGWLPEEELPDIVALSQSAPGVMAVNISIFAGHRLRGVRGSLAATLGSILPSFLIILAIALFFTAFRDNPWVERAFKGIRPVASTRQQHPYLLPTELYSTQTGIPLQWQVLPRI